MKNFKYILWGIGILIAVLLVFKIGMMVGLKKADFSYKWGENYHRNFGGPRGGFLRDFSDKDFVDGHGVFGQIIKIENQVLTIKDPSNTEKAVKADEKTPIKRFMEDVKLTDLKVNDFVVVIGGPNDAGQIEAKLIRLMPPPPAAPPFPPPPRHSGKFPRFFP